MNRTLILMLALALPLALGSCGKRGDPVPPPGEEESYAYPRVYPYPPSVLPEADSTAQGQEEEVPQQRRTTSNPPRTRTTVYEPIE
jgi:predicted small lipoprotein YifL